MIPPSSVRRDALDRWDTDHPHRVCRTRAASGAAAPPMSVMNSRRFTRSPRPRGHRVVGHHAVAVVPGAQGDAHAPAEAASWSRASTPELLGYHLRVVGHYQPATTDLLIDAGYKVIDRESASVLHLHLPGLPANLPGEIAIDVNARFAQ
jgi:hypothetical protein